MANQTNASTPYDSYEYYLDYLDLIPVDERKLKANKCELRRSLGGGRGVGPKDFLHSPPAPIGVKDEPKLDPVHRDRRKQE